MLGLFFILMQLFGKFVLKNAEEKVMKIGPIVEEAVSFICDTYDNLDRYLRYK